MIHFFVVILHPFPMQFGMSGGWILVCLWLMKVLFSKKKKKKAVYRKLPLNGRIIHNIAYESQRSNYAKMTIYYF